MVSILRPLTVEAALADGLTPHENGRGEKFVQLYQRLPLGEWFYTSFEKNYDTDAGVRFAREHMALPVILCVIYLALIYQCSRFMYRPGQQRFDLRYPLAYWNAALSLFSFLGAMRTVPELIYRLGSANSVLETISANPASSWGVGATGLWVQLFIYSKIPELVDTAFIVARQRPLLFLHWYHHVTVLLYCWHSYATEAPQALYFVAMNYSVHAVMYAYYCLKALKIKPPIPDKAITTIQILQMVVGTAIQCSSMYFYSKDEGASCKVDYSNLVAGALMYGSYFCLFFKFAIERYFKKPDGAAKKAKKQA